MGWLLIGNDAEGIGRGLILGTISTFVWRNRVQPRKPPVRRAARVSGYEPRTSRICSSATHLTAKAKQCKWLDLYACSGGEDGRSSEALLHADWWRSARLLNLCTRRQWVVSFTRWLLCNGEGFWTGGRPHLTYTAVVMYIFDNIQFVSFRVHNIFTSLINTSINLSAMSSKFVTTLPSSVDVGGRNQGRQRLTVS